MKNKKNNTDMISTNHIGRNTKLLLICFLLLTSLLLSSCESHWQYNANLYRIRDFSSAVADDFGELSIKDVFIDDEEKSFSMTYTGPKTIAEFDQIRESINDYLAGNPDYFLNDNYSITIYFDVDSRRYYSNNNNLITNRKYPFDEKNDELYEGLALMEISNGYEESYKISQIEGHCTTLKAIALDAIPLIDLEVLQKLPALESVMLVDVYGEENIRPVREALPECKVTSVRRYA